MTNRRHATQQCSAEIALGVHYIVHLVLARQGDVPQRGVSRQPGQVEIHMLSVPLRAAESGQYR